MYNLGYIAGIAVGLAVIMVRFIWCCILMEGARCHSLHFTDRCFTWFCHSNVYNWLFLLTVSGYDLQLHPLLSLQRGSIRGVRGTVLWTAGIGDVQHWLVLLTVKISVFLCKHSSKSSCLRLHRTRYLPFTIKDFVGIQSIFVYLKKHLM